MQHTWGIDYHCVKNGVFLKIPLFEIWTTFFFSHIKTYNFYTLLRHILLRGNFFLFNSSNLIFRMRISKVATILDSRALVVDMYLPQYVREKKICINRDKHNIYLANSQFLKIKCATWQPLSLICHID